MNDDIRPKIAAPEANIRLHLGIERSRRDLFGKLIHESFRAAAQAVDVLAYEASLFHQ